MFMREWSPDPRRLGGFKRLPADCIRYTQQDCGSRTFSDLNHRFTATVLWPSPDANTTSSRRADPACTATLRWFRLSSKR